MKCSSCRMSLARKGTFAHHHPNRTISHVEREWRKGAYRTGWILTLCVRHEPVLTSRCGPQRSVFKSDSDRASCRRSYRCVRLIERDSSAW